MTWWIWLIIGLILVVAELLFPAGFFFFFFGVAGLILGLLTFLGVIVTLSIATLFFVVIAAGLSFWVRRPLLERLKWSGDVKPFAEAGEDVLIVEDIPPGATGAGVLRGVAWRVRNVSGAFVASGSQQKVCRVEGITLIVE